MRQFYVLLSCLLALLTLPGRADATCSATGFYRDNINLTAAMINPATVSGDVDATGCHIAVYYGPGASGVVKAANIYGANYFGVLVNGDQGVVNVDVLNSTIHDIGETPLNGEQHGVAIYYRGLTSVSAVTGKIAGNSVSKYQKGGIVANGPGVQVAIMDNVVAGEGHIVYTAQNGIQVGYGANAIVMRNTVSGNSYRGGTWSAGGILVVGGPGYGGCPDGSPCYTVNTKINDNTLVNNDVGVYLSNCADDWCVAPAEATNVKVVNNTISNDTCWNSYYQAAISDVGNNDKMINNKISGSTCTSTYNPSGVDVDADTSFTNRPKIHANK